MQKQPLQIPLPSSLAIHAADMAVMEPAGVLVHHGLEHNQINAYLDIFIFQFSPQWGPKSLQPHSLLIHFIPQNNPMR